MGVGSVASQWELCEALGQCQQQCWKGLVVVRCQYGKILGFCEPFPRMLDNTKTERFLCLLLQKLGVGAGGMRCHKRVDAGEHCFGLELCTAGGTELPALRSSQPALLSS